MRRTPLPPLLAVAAAFAIVAPALAQTVDTGRLQLEQRLDRVRGSLSAAQERVGSLETELSALGDDEAGLRARVIEVAGRISVVEQRIASEEAALASVGQQRSDIERQLVARRSELAQVMAALQRIGRRPPPALALEGDGPLSAVRSAISLNAVLPALNAQTEELAATLEEAERLSAVEQLTFEALTTELASLRGEQSRLDGLQDELGRRRAISQFERGRALAQLQRLAQEAESVEALINGLRSGDAVDNVPAAGRFDLQRGSLSAPVAGRFVARYGEPTRQGSVTRGDVIAALPQAVVIAPADAVILFAAPFRSFETVLILDVGSGYHLVLSGLSDSFVEVGQSVEAGEAIGRMGTEVSQAALISAGGVSADRIGARPALYVELRKDGAAIDSHGWWRAGIAKLEGTTG